MSEHKDSADSAADRDIAARASRANKNRVIQNETDDLVKKQVPGGRKQVLDMKVPGSDAEDPNHRAMAQHSADFIAEGTSLKPNRAKLEAEYV
jgi:hypothetical protein